MTDLEQSPVTRRTSGKHLGKRIIITLSKDDTIHMRLEYAREPFARIPILELAKHHTWSGYGIKPR